MFGDNRVTLTMNLKYLTADDSPSYHLASISSMILNCSKMPQWHWVSKQNPLWQLLRLLLMPYLWERRYTQNYTAHLKAADGAYTWQQEQFWLSSSSTREVNMLQKCAARQQLCFCCWTTGIRGPWRRGKKKIKIRRCIFTGDIILIWEVCETRQLWEAKVWKRSVRLCVELPNHFRQLESTLCGG